MLYIRVNCRLEIQKVCWQNVFLKQDIWYRHVYLSCYVPSKNTKSRHHHRRCFPTPLLNPAFTTRHMHWVDTRGYQKVRRLIRLNQHLIWYAYKLYRGYKTTMIYQLCKFKLDTLMINHFIIENGHPQSPLSSVTFERR